MTSARRLLLAAAVGSLAACTTMPPAPSTVAALDLEALQRDVRATEVAFARSMADRDFAAFERHVSPHAVFWAGRRVLRGKAAVLADWKRFYEGPQAPFSWEPDDVVVLGDGTLAQSTGPVRDTEGRVIARFRSVWRREPDGRWLIVLDRGEPADTPKP
jgi:ketosteroid isomerase-like protein